MEAAQICNGMLFVASHFGECFYFLAWWRSGSATQHEGPGLDSRIEQGAFLRHFSWLFPPSDDIIFADDIFLPT